MAGIDRTAAAALFQDEVAPEVVAKATRSSVALSDFNPRNMGSKVTRMPVRASLPDAEWIAADQDEKSESSYNWADKLLTAEEIAVIVPISESVIEDASIDVVQDAIDVIGEALGKKIDQTVFFGTGGTKPPSFPDGLHVLAAGAGQSVISTNTPGDDYNNLFGIVEDLDYDVTNVYGPRSIKGRLRGQKTSTGSPVYNPADGAGSFGAVYGIQLGFPIGWDKTASESIVVDRLGVKMGIRQDVTIKILTEATLPSGLNLAASDSIAVRAMMRVAYQVVDPISVETGARKYPVATLTPAP